MFEKDTFATLRHSQEEKYFIQKEQELIQQLRRRLELEHEIENLTHTKEVITEDLVRDLQSLGFTAETFSLLHFVPLVRVAWSEGFINDRERKIVLNIAHHRGIQEGSTQHKQLEAWLTESPTEEFFQKSIGIFQTLLHALPPEEEKAEKQELIEECTEVAEASRQLLGYWGPIPQIEKETINRITAELEGRGMRDEG
jgi:hypothetical protein